MGWAPILRRGAVVFLLAGVALPAWADGRSLGDVNNDGTVTVEDLVRQIRHMRGQEILSDEDRAYADVNADGVCNDADSAEIVRVILGTQNPALLPPARILDTSPATGESAVAISREFVVRFSLPLAPDTVLAATDPATGNRGNFYAEFGGNVISSRVELSSDRRKATLFFLESPASARVRVVLNSAGIRDLAGHFLDPGGDGQPGTKVVSDFDTLTVSALADIGVAGTVFGTDGAGVSQPLAGVTVSVGGAEATLRTTTAADGKFVLSPVPTGKFSVTFDGRTAAAPAGGYYSVIRRICLGVPGQLNTPVSAATVATPAGAIYLPFVAGGTLQDVSQTADTEIAVAPAAVAANPLLAGVKVRVPASSLFADNGTRGGKVGISQVASDRLPEQLPAGVRLPLVVTLQTDGAGNFDKPVRVRIPNLPDPATGQALAAGAKSALIGFDQKSGAWEVHGPMTVTADGQFVESDEGDGIRQPGILGTKPLSRMTLQLSTRQKFFRTFNRYILDPSGLPTVPIRTPVTGHRD